MSTVLTEQPTTLEAQLLTSLRAARKGDFSARMPSHWTGAAGKIADEFNELLELNAGLARELSRLHDGVGREGRTTQRASLGDVGGAWAGMMESVNSLIADLVRPTDEMARVVGAVAAGDLSQRIVVDIDDRPFRGEFLRAARTVNTMVDRLTSFTGEVTRVAREVGTDGKLGGQAKVKGVSGIWKDLTDSVNNMASNLTSQVRNIAEVTTAVANGDLSKKVTVDVRGEFLKVKDTINTMVDQLSSFAAEVTRVAREVGSEGKLGGQAHVRGVSGTWKDLTDNVNFMAANLTNQVRNIATVTTAVAKGDLSKKVTVDVRGEFLELKETINTMVDQLSSFAAEVTRVAREVGSEGKLGGQAEVRDVSGTWKDLTDSVNGMAANLTSQVRNIAEVTTAVATGDLSKKITVDVKGEILELKNTINTMVDQLSSFAAEVTRVAREVGSEGKLGGQADVPGVSGTWKDLTDNVNSMAANLTSQVRNIADVTTAVATGDLSKKITVDVKGEILELKNTINTMVDQLSSFAAEVTRVAREVGSEGKLGGQAEVKGVSGTWKDLTDSVNGMAANLTSQVRNIAEVTTAVATGDLSKQITVDVRGEFLELKETINTMVDQLSSFAAEVTRVAREVGSEGKLGGQAEVRGVSGTWKDLTDSVNEMAANLTSQVRNIAEVTTAVATGDLSKKITVDVRGEILELKKTVNTMVDQLSSFAAEVTRVAREVGSEGKLGGQADVKGVSGTWKDLTDSVNGMAANLTSQVRNIAEVTTAVANGDLSKKITVDVRGEIFELKRTVNTMVDQLNSFAAEVTRVAREVGSEGKLGGQAEVRGVAGTWKDLTDSVNGMAANLTSQVRNIAEVTTAVANGDLSKKITVDVRGEILELKKTVNTMVDQLRSFAAEVTRVAREVGSEGKLGGQAEVKDVAGTWKDLTENVNSMASNLTAQVRNIADVTIAVANGDLSKKITVDVRGEFLQLKDTINTMVDQLRAFASEVTRVAREVGTDGKLGGQAYVHGVSGTWKDLTDNVNSMAGNLTSQVRNIAAVTTAVATGDLSKKITVGARGEILELKDTINTMVDQLSSFAAEVTRVAREVGTDGKLGGQADVKGVSGTWKDLTENVNSMAANLTSQVRGIAKVVTAVARGDLMKKLVVAAKGEIAELADTINGMIDTLATFADQVTTVAREVGVEGKLGGQASVPGAAGTWRDLTDNVNQLAANLTTQVRAIADVAIAVTKGDLTRSIGVETRGEVAILRDTINEMIRNLRETTQKNSEQDWLKTNLAKFTRMLQGQRDLQTVSKLILRELAMVVSARLGVFYVIDGAKGDSRLRLIASYGAEKLEEVPRDLTLGEGLIGQAALERERILLTNVPADYIRVSSGLGAATPASVMVLPTLFEGQVKAVIELASFDQFSATHQTFLEQLAESIGIVLNTIEANMRTEELLKQSQSLAQELQQTNAELESKARLLVDQKAEVEQKNREVELAKQALEEKAEQLALTSKYKSEFLSNMSHELRTPLNSLLILSKQLGDNPEGNLLPRQVEFARTIYSSGSDLLALINDILDLSKIESGTVTIDVGEALFSEITDQLERTFRPVADGKDLAFDIELESDLPSAIYTDAKRLLQVLKNLLSNAFKFTPAGQVQLRISTATTGWSPQHPILSRANMVIAFSVRDTGIGIAIEKQRVIFEAFQQADGSTSRKYGGTGLGLSISRELTRLLGGEIVLESAPQQGSTFTLYVPRIHVAPKRARPDVPPDRLLGDSFAEDSTRAIPGAGRLRRLLDEADDDRTLVQSSEPVVLIVEDDIDFARVLMHTVHEHGFKAVIATTGEAALTLARQFRPIAITLDLHLPDMDGWTLLEQLRDDASTRHVPVHVISGDETLPDAGRDDLTILRKPVSRESLDSAFSAVRAGAPALKNLLLVEDDHVQRDALVQMIDQNGIRTTAVGTAAEALEALRGGQFDCMVVDLKLPDMTGAKLIEAVRREPGLGDLPIVVHTSKDLTRREKSRLMKSAQSVIVKDARAPRRLLDEVTLFLHRLDVRRPKPVMELGGDGAADQSLAQKRVLVVDDDIRNIFALTGLLERQGMSVLSAENGRDGISVLQQSEGIDIVLMDVMMPEMDGYETMRAIRNIPTFRDLPIIAVTAKAMRGDREKCIDAGASDYVSKPVDSEQLLALMRAWMKR